MYLIYLLIASLMLAACTNDNPQSPSKLSQVRFDVRFPSLLQPEVHASFIDPSTSEIVIGVRSADVGGFDEIESTMIGWYTCALDLGFPEDVSIETAEVDCGLYPVARQSHEVLAILRLDRDNPSGSLELEPGRYRFTISQRDEIEASLDSSFAVTHLYVTLEPGQNNLVANLIYADWIFENSPIYRVLNSTSVHENFLEWLTSENTELHEHSNLVSGVLSGEGWFSSFPYSWDFDGETLSTPLAALGLGSLESDYQLHSIRLDGVDLNPISNQEDPLQGWNQFNSPYFQGTEAGAGRSYFDWIRGEQRRCDNLRCLVKRLTPGALSPQGVQWIARDAQEPELKVNMGWEADEASGRGIANPALILQEYKNGKNRHQLSLGEVSFQQVNNSAYNTAGLFFYGVDGEQVTEPKQEGSIWEQAQLNITGETSTYPIYDPNDMFTVIGEGKVVELSANYAKVWVDEDFPKIQPTRLINGNQIEGTLVEYVRFRRTNYTTSPSTLQVITPLPISFEGTEETLDLGKPSNEVQFEQLPVTHNEMASITRVINQLASNGDAAAAAGSITASQVGAAEVAMPATSGCFYLHEIWHDYGKHYEWNEELENWYEASEGISNTSNAMDENIYRVCLHPVVLNASVVSD